MLVAVEGAGEMAALETLGRQVGMHVAATRPEALDIAGVDPAALEREKAVLTEQARASGRPDNIIEKMVEGRIRKFYEEVVLLEQVWVHDGESRVKAVVAEGRREADRFARFQLGEGIEKPEGRTSPPRSPRQPGSSRSGCSRRSFGSLLFRSRSTKASTTLFLTPICRLIETCRSLLSS